MSINKLKVAFHTLGCKVNQYETEAMKEQFRAAGCTVVGEEDTADVYVINTCTVTNLADRKSRQYIRRMKKKCPEAVIAVTGCYAQVKPEEVSALEEADIVAGTGEKNNILSYVQQFMEERQRQTHIKSYDELTGYDEKGVITSLESRTRAYIKIQEGCDRFCSYCLIPFARGHVRSRNPEEITEEAETLIRQGFKEIILTGINTALYGAEENFSYPLKPDEEAAGMRGIEIIIKRINDLEGDFRIRLSSLEPTVINAAYVRELMKYDKLCHHLHLSVQSGSNHVLKLMNRRYDRSEYLEIVKVLREFDPLYGITTDIICGFPGETDKDFEDSLDIIEQVKFCKVHAFRYSKRRGTAAALMEGQVSGEVKKRRSDRLIEAGEKAAAEFMESCRNSVRPVLFEEVCGTLVAGYSDNYIKVYAEGGEDDLNRIRNVKLSENYKDGMKGEIE